MKFFIKNLTRVKSHIFGFGKWRRKRRFHNLAMNLWIFGCCKSISTLSSRCFLMSSSALPTSPAASPIWLTTALLRSPLVTLACMSRSHSLSSLNSLASRKEACDCWIFSLRLCSCWSSSLYVVSASSSRVSMCSFVSGYWVQRRRDSELKLRKRKEEKN